MIYAKYTVVLKTLLDDPVVKEKIDAALSTYPMYEPENEMLYAFIPTREQLNKKLLDYYKYREIGFESVGRFLDELEIAMNEIMPYYNQLFKSQDVMNAIEDVFGNVDIKEMFEEEREDNSTGSTSGTTKNTSDSSSTSKTDSSSESSATGQTTNDSTNNSKNVKSTTPQGVLNHSTKEIDSVDYADEVNWNEDLNNSTGNTTSSDNSTSSATSTNNSELSSESESSGQSSNNTTGTTKHTFTKKGNQGVNTYAHDMKEFREIFLNIEQQIINDPRITELFMTVY